MFKNLSQKQALQALLLSLQALNAMNPDEKKRLKNIANRLASGQDWEAEIKPNLLEIINESNQFKQSFIEAKNQLDQMSEAEISDLFPTVNELKQVFPSKSIFQPKISKPTDPIDRDGDPLYNMVIEVFAAAEPEKKASELFQARKNNQQKSKTQNNNPCE